MAFPTAVNSQITDAVTQVNVKVLGDSPAVPMGNLYQATAQALSNAAHNATSAQSHAYITAQASTTQGVTTLLTLDTASTGQAAAAMLMGPGVTDAHLETVATDPDVIALHLGGFRLSDAGVAHLATMRPRLQYLHLGDTEISEEQEKRLRSCLPETEIQKV